MGSSPPNNPPTEHFRVEEQQGHVLRFSRPGLVCCLVSNPLPSLSVSPLEARVVAPPSFAIW